MSHHRCNLHKLNDSHPFLAPRHNSCINHQPKGAAHWNSKSMSSIFIPNKCPVKIMSLTNFNNKIIWCTSLTDPSVKQSSMLLFTHHPTQIPNWNEQIDSNKKHQSDKTHKAAKKNKLLLDKIRTTKTVHTVFWGIYSPLKLTASSPLEKKSRNATMNELRAFAVKISGKVK